MWFIFALLGAFLWTIVSLFDKYSVHSIFTRASQGLIVSGIFSGVGFIFADWSNLDTSLFFWSVVAGLLLQFSQFCYFSALEDEEVGDLTAFGSSYPLLVALFVIPFGKFLNPAQWLGIVLIVVGVVFLRWKRAQKAASRSVKYVVGYVLGLALSSLVVSEVMDSYSFLSTLGPYCIGIVVGGLSPLLIIKERKEFKDVIKIHLPKFWLFALIEILNVAAVAAEVYAISIGHPALVNAVASTEPALVFIFAHSLGSIKGLGIVFPKTSQIHHKLMITFLIILGLGLIAWK